MELRPLSTGARSTGSKVEKTVLRLQHRIFMAKVKGDVKGMESLQRLLASSRAAKLLAIRKVGQENSGRKTPGIDGVVSISDARPGAFVSGRSEPEGLRSFAGATGVHPESQRQATSFGHPYDERSGDAMPGETGPGTGMGSGFRAALVRLPAGTLSARCSGGGQTRLGSRRCRTTRINGHDAAGFLDADIKSFFDEIDHDVILSGHPSFAE